MERVRPHRAGPFEVISGGRRRRGSLRSIAGRWRLDERAIELIVLATMALALGILFTRIDDVEPGAHATALYAAHESPAGPAPRGLAALPRLSEFVGELLLGPAPREESAAAGR